MPCPGRPLEHELARTGAAIDRYLTAFENGTLDPEDLAGRLTQRKALIDAFIAQVKITGPDRIVPVFRIPQPPASDQAHVPAGKATARSATVEDPVRAMTNLVGWWGAWGSNPEPTD